MIAIENVYVDSAPGSQGTKWVRGMGDYIANLVQLSVTSVEFEFVSGGELVDITVDPSFAILEGEQVLVWWMRGVAAGPVVGRFWFALSDGERDAVPFVFEVVP